MKRITKSVTALFMVLVVCSLSIINAFAANDPVQNVSYSYSETGNCTVDYGGIVYVSNSYNCTHRFTVNGRIATCTWSLNSTPSKGTYNNATKYYLAKSAMRATETVVDHFLKSGSSQEQGYKNCVTLMKLAEKGSKGKLEFACERMLELSSVPSIRTIAVILKNGKEPERKSVGEADSEKYGITRGTAYFKKGGDRNA